MRKRLLVAVIGLMAIFTAGCNNYLGNKDVGEHGDKYGNVRGMKNDVTSDTVTDQNPNFLNLSSDDNYHVNNLGFAVDRVKEMVRLDNRFKVGAITRNGSTMNVTVHPNGHMSRGQQQKAAAQLEKKITAALPTYTININIE
jgi:predicted small secreted protein